MPFSLFSRLLGLFLVVPIAELFLLLWIGERIGFWPTIGLIVLTAVVGSWLAQREGLAAVRRFQTRMAQGGLPGRELTDGLIILVSGALLLTPGVLTDVVGFLGLLPPTRALIRTRLQERVKRGIASGTVTTFSMRSTPPPSASPPTAAPPAEYSGEAGIEEAKVIEEP